MNGVGAAVVYGGFELAVGVTALLLPETTGQKESSSDRRLWTVWNEKPLVSERLPFPLDLLQVFDIWLFH